MIKHLKNPLVTTWFSHHAKNMIRNRFCRVSLTAQSALPAFEEGVPVLAISNHASWWDALLAMYLSHFVFKKECYGVMAEEQLRRYGIFRLVGAYSVDRTSTREGRQFLEYTQELLVGTGRLLWIYPQGELYSNELLPMEFKSGFGHIASRLGRMHILKMIASYDFWIEPLPEIVIDILPLETLEAEKRPGFADELSGRLEREMTVRAQEVRRIVRTRDRSALRPLMAQAGGTHPVYDVYRRIKSGFKHERFVKSHGEV